MRVIVEGADGCGKSTLVNYLVDKYNLKMIHLNSETKNDFEFHSELLDEDNVVFDRFNLGEIVYPLIYGRQPKMTWDEQLKILSKCDEKDFIFIIFYASDFNTLKSRLFTRGDTIEVLQNAERLNTLYRILVSSLSNFKCVHSIDISKIDNQIDFFENIKDFEFEGE